MEDWLHLESSLQWDESLHRAVHSLGGVPRHFKLHELADVFHRLEHFMLAAKDKCQPLPEGSDRLVEECVQFTYQAIAHFDAQEPQDKQWADDLCQRITGLQEHIQPEPEKHTPTENPESEHKDAEESTLLTDSMSEPKEDTLAERFESESKDEETKASALFPDNSLEPDSEAKIEVIKTDWFTPFKNIPFDDYQDYAIASDDADPEILEIFLEEAEEQREIINENYPLWRANTALEEELTTFRRAFHTLKGSGRLMGANLLGEYAWSFENLLNRIIDNTVDLSPEIFVLLDKGIAELDFLVPQLQSLEPAPDKVYHLIAIAHEVAAGKLDLTQIPEPEPVVQELEPVVQEPELVVEKEIVATEAAAEIFEELPEKPIEKPEQRTLQIVPPELHLDQLELPEISPVEPTIEDEMALPKTEFTEQNQNDEASSEDAELLELFLEEAEELLEVMQSSLQPYHAKVQNNEGIDTTLKQTIFTQMGRYLHTFKGSARMAGLMYIGELCHQVESLLNLADSDDRIVNAFDMLSKAQDKLDDVVNALSQPNRAYALQIQQSLLTPLLLDLQEQTQEEIQLPLPELEAEEKDSSLSVDYSGLLEKMLVSEEHATAEQKQAKSQAKGQESDTANTVIEKVRIEAGKLDELINLAGETRSWQARLHEEIHKSTYNLDELGRTIIRLREQLRKLEMETEAQIRHSYEIEQEQHGLSSEFDPLEMDRYSDLQQLSRALAESVNDLSNIERYTIGQMQNSEALMQQQLRVSKTLQQGLLDTRMTEFQKIVPRLQRVVKLAAEETGKKVRFEVIGEERELDRNILQHLSAPLEHLLRNAVSHGIELPDKRSSVGKSEEGSVRVEVFRERSGILLRVVDDGRGINPKAVRERAVHMGLIPESVELSEEQVYGLILHSGFTTLKNVNQLAGRGVGMDVVNSEIRQLGGRLHIESMSGWGTSFTIRLPVSFATTQALQVRVGQEVFAIPMTSVIALRTLKQAQQQHHIEYAGEHWLVRYMGYCLGVENAPPIVEDQNLPLLLLQHGNRRVAFQIDATLERGEVVVKTLNPLLQQSKIISAATILNNGDVVLIPDVPELVRLGVLNEQVLTQHDEQVASEEVKVPSVMVVDDSITIRRVTEKMLVSNGYRVILAKDGLDALTVLENEEPDLMLLDIEMPRMDGFELLERLRQQAAWKNLPVIMITSRTGDKHRKRAEAIGVSRYLGKPYQEKVLLSEIGGILYNNEELKERHSRAEATSPVFSLPKSRAIKMKTVNDTVLEIAE